jgi:hypothetical protein
MTTSKIVFRDFLGLILIISVILFLAGILLDGLALAAYFAHEESLVGTFISESLPLYPFIILVPFLARYINRPELVASIQAYRLQVLRKQRAKAS